MLKFIAISPHPPIIIPEVGGENIKKVVKTISALKKLNEELIKIKPDTIIVVSPHAPTEMDKFALNLAPEFWGDFALNFKNDLDLSQKIAKLPDIISIEQAQLDHGTLVPLYYLTKNLKPKLISLSFSFLDFKKHFSFGQELQKIIQKENKNIVFIASGDLSHCLTPDAPAGFNPAGKKFDQLIVEYLKNKEVQKIINFDLSFIESAGECGLRSILILLGLLSDLNYNSEILSYEGPFGVGYLVANFKL